ncbi:MAG: hypothetical protein IJT89_05575 [Bacteroidaceae bacterium]|nr:hypothetical protein [Bacteroidaceae bacterium]MBQ7483499.1 hypothetical protein [Bacteroidaceae bacterium]
MKEQVLQAMRNAGKPVSAGDVTKAPDFITFLRHYIAQIENQAVTSK